MPYNVSNFIAQLSGDGARSNLFEVTFNFPALLGEQNASRAMTLLCKSASLPGRSIGTVPLFYFGRELKFAGNATFADWTVTVINDEDFQIRNAFEVWMNAINTHVTNLRTIGTAPADYQVDAQIIQYGKAGNALKGYNMIGLFPVDLSPIDVDWGTNDTIEDFTITLAYQWWEASAPGGQLITDGESAPINLPTITG